MRERRRTSSTKECNDGFSLRDPQLLHPAASGASVLTEQVKFWDKWFLFFRMSALPKTRVLLHSRTSSTNHSSWVVEGRPSGTVHRSAVTSAENDTWHPHAMNEGTLNTVRLTYIFMLHISMYNEMKDILIPHVITVIVQHIFTYH